jgi:hypothetical protein
LSYNNLKLNTKKTVWASHLFVILLLLIIIPGKTKAQTKNQEATVLIYNIGFGGLTSGIGSLINKPKGSKWHKSFIRGFWQGSIGGLVNYSSKKTLYLVNRNQNTFYALPATILNAAGYSIIEKAALNKPFLQNWCIDYGPLRFDFSIKNKEDFRVRFLPQTVDGFIFVSQDGKFDLSTSLITGSIVFKGNKPIIIPNANYTADGYAIGRAFIYTDYPGTNKYHNIAHEMVHYYQYRDYQIFNSWLNPISKKVKSPIINKIFSKYVYLDIPYFWIFYHIEGYQTYQNYYRNFYEFEAERFTTNSYVHIK